MNGFTEEMHITSRIRTSPSIKKCKLKPRDPFKPTNLVLNIDNDQCGHNCEKMNSHILLISYQCCDMQIQIKFWEGNSVLLTNSKMHTLTSRTVLHKLLTGAKAYVPGCSVWCGSSWRKTGSKPLAAGRGKMVPSEP